MLNTKLLAALTAGLLVTTSVASGVVHPALSAQSRQRVFFPNRALSLIYDQSDNDNGQGIVVDNFLDSGFDAYDSEGADDFNVPAGEIWAIKEVYVDGTYFDGSGPADSFNVTFYKSTRRGKVGELIKACPNAPYRFDAQFDFGSEYITCKTNLPKGRYFVAIQANVFFAAGGEWGWLTNNAIRQNQSQWRNPGGGFGVGCEKFAPTLECIPNDEGGDYAFALYGKVRDSSP